MLFSTFLEVVLLSKEDAKLSVLLCNINKNIPLSLGFRKHTCNDMHGIIVVSTVCSERPLLHGMKRASHLLAMVRCEPRCCGNSAQR